VQKQFVLVLCAALGLTACGGTAFPASSATTSSAPPNARANADPRPESRSASPRQSPTKHSAPTTVRPAAPRPSTPKDPSPFTTGVALHSLVPPLSVLGNEWADDGDQPSSLDLDSPPRSCAPFTDGFDGRVDELVHEFSFLPTADGNSEQGHIGMNAVQARSAAAVSDELAAVANPSYAPCADDTAIRGFTETSDGTIDSVTERPMTAPISKPFVAWRVTIVSHRPSHAPETSYMDIGYLGAGSALVKIRISSCGCRPPVGPDTEILPGENAALLTIAQRLFSAGTTAG
jgi:hypothetical protein